MAIEKLIITCKTQK